MVIIKKICKFIKSILQLPQILKYYIIYILKANQSQYRDCWLICERGTEAKDNGYVLFEYIRKNQPDKNVFYLIDKNCVNDYKKVEKIGNVIEYGSREHKIAFMGSSKLISTHRGYIEPWNYKFFDLLFGKSKLKKKYIFLQHGITKDDVSNILSKKKTKFDLFICGAKYEYDYIKENFGYSEKEVKYTGFARFDKLESVNKNQILLMPTWRSYISDAEWVNKQEEFIESEYFKKYQSLINNKNLINILEKNNINLLFYPHYQIQKYLNLFKSSSKNIKLCDKNSYDVQSLLRESLLLITDYSSVFFDFAYMKKPIIFYQFDKERFFNFHYKKGYFSYTNHGFGSIVKEEEEVIYEIINVINNKFNIEDKYDKRIDLFFEKRDKNNCKRILYEINQI